MFDYRQRNSYKKLNDYYIKELREHKSPFYLKDKRGSMPDLHIKSSSMLPFSTIFSTYTFYSY